MRIISSRRGSGSGRGWNSRLLVMGQLSSIAYNGVHVVCTARPASILVPLGTVCKQVERAIQPGQLFRIKCKGKVGRSIVYTPEVRGVYDISTLQKP